MSLLTLQQVQNSRVKEIADSLPTSNQFISLVNAAAAQLMERGNWWGTVQPLMGCTYDGCVTWPRRVKAVLALNVRGRHTQLANRWYQYMDWSHSDYRGLYDSWRRNNRQFVTVSDGSLPVFSPIPCGVPRFVRFYIDSATDIGKTIVLYGKGSNGQVLWGQRSDGTTQEGLVLTLALPYVQTEVPLLEIFRVVKDMTSARVRGYQLDSAGNHYDMAVYEPSEVSPDYVHTKVPGACGQCGTITALVKLAHVPALYPDDVIGIENISALRDMVFSIKKKEAGDLQSAMALEKSALKELNYEMRTRFPDEQFIVNFQPFGRGNELNNFHTRISMI